MLILEHMILLDQIQHSLLLLLFFTLAEVGKIIVDRRFGTTRVRNMAEGEFTAGAAGFNDDIAIAKNILDKTDIIGNVLNRAKRSPAPALGAEGPFVNIGDILTSQDIEIVLVLLANPEGPTDTYKRDR